ncbi:signal transduction histidine kinase [Mucilaginibacter oryzae]|uniref:histidine kinase n=1 Tax=Mucilaginibacter oryzae TaxID=468058 RepID=A0A316H6J5_9SPHI|nr:two-component regulator propeller domain-containing protein [Mucilaginibacter oryzae]PWK76624.1 signal transduction histidine kinase [Mucilaginibacter oryzae]
MAIDLLYFEKSGLYAIPGANDCESGLSKKNVSGSYLLRIRMVIFLVLFYLYPALGQGQVMMKSLSIENGLSNNFVRCIFQDKKGFMWFGTFDGLNRYDGYEFKIFRNKFNDSTSLRHNYIYAISEDKQQNIWVGTGQGLTILDPVTEKFHSVYYLAYWNHKLTKLNYSITFIKSDKWGNLFIGTNNAGLYMKRADDSICVQLHFKNENRSFYSATCQGISINRDGTWIFVANYGLCRFNYKTGEIELVDRSVLSANCIYAANNGDVFLGSYNGLYRYTQKNRSGSKLFPSAKIEVGGSNVISLLPVDNQKLYFGVEHAGLYVFNLNSGKLDAIPQGETPGKLDSKIIMDLYQDHESRIWIATLRAGINIIDSQKGIFQTFRHDRGDPHSLASNFVTSFCESDTNHVWIGTEDRGVSVWDVSKNQFNNLTYLQKDHSSLTSGEITAIRKDFKNKIWVATTGGGLNRFDPVTNLFEHFICKNEMTGEAQNEVWFVFEDSKRNLWAGTFNNGRLYKLNRAKNRFEVFDQNISDPFCFYEDRRGQLWCGTAERLIKIDTAAKRHQYYAFDKPVRAIYEDHAGRFWVGTEGGGICLFDRKKEKITERFTDSDGLSNNAVLNILEDGAGKLWLSTFQGLTNFDPDKKKLTGYFASDGLQSNQFSLHAALKLKSGKLLFGGIKGFNVVDPAVITTRTTMPDVVFTDININNRDITDLDKIISSHHTNQLQGIRVPYNDAVLSFSFAGLEFSSPDHISYAYYLEGWDKKWIQSGKQRTINYNNLPEGNYTLHVKSTNALGKWNDKQTTLQIVVLPPWFRSVWAYILYTICCCGLIYPFIRYRSEQQRLKFQIQLERMNSEKEHEINLRKTSFFTHVSHEFRTPLMLIINPLQEMLPKTDNDGNLGIVYRNARRLLSLVDQLLLFNKTENDNDKFEISRINFSGLCKLAFECFTQQARVKNIDYKFVAGGDEIILYGDMAKLEVILYNLLSNAFKFCKTGGAVILKVEELDDTINVSVSDNGQGIAPEVGNQLFEKFYRSKDKEAQHKAGFGIGLYLVKQFVDMHEGEVTYSSRMGEGTTFYLKFKKGKEHFEGQGTAVSSDQEAIFLDELSGEQMAAFDGFANAGINASRPGETMPPASGLPHLADDPVSSKKIMLIIDDHTDMRTYLKQIFSGEFMVIEANSGEMGIQAAKEYIPDIILSDVMMDNKNGIEFCNEVRANPSLTHIPLILITASVSPEIRLSGVQGGADDYFTKPVNKELLAARITTLLKNRNNLQNYFFRKITMQEHNIKISEDEKNFIDQCIRIIEQRIDDDDFNVDVLATELHMSRSNLFKKIKAVSNQTPNNFIKYIRLKQAAEYFINSGGNVNEIALLVGFKDVRYFREQFFQLFGLRPSDYIKKYRKNFSKTLSLNVSLKKNPYHGG